MESLSDKINNHLKDSALPFFSVEFFPPRTSQHLKDLQNIFHHYKDGLPLFINVTWKPNSSSSSNDISSLSVSSYLVNTLKQEVVLHMAAFNLTKEQAKNHLLNAKKLGIRNILALRGDYPPEWTEKQINSPRDFRCAYDLVKFIRENFDTYFTIGVAGYPNGHKDTITRQMDLEYLKLKVNTGADFIITQLFFSFEDFRTFVRDCRDVGIKVPILPGIFAIENIRSIDVIKKLTGLEVPSFITNAIKYMNEDELSEYGIVCAYDICKKILAAKLSPGLHFYTMNKSFASTEIIKRLGLWQSSLRIIESKFLQLNQHESVLDESNEKSIK